jgi:GNAT superfamily N-acetyltransferase
MMLEDDPPEEEFARFVARDGFEYRIVGYFDEGIVILNLVSGSRRYGKVQGFLYEDRTLLIGDLMVFKPRPIPVWARWLERWWPQPGARGRHLGSMLLDTIISVARQRGVRWIDAGVTDDDLALSSYLLKWYLSRGFTKLPVSATSSAYGLQIRLMLEAKLDV